MDIPITKLAGFGLLFVVIFFFGFWLSRSGKPYNPLLFNLHKLIALGTVVFLGFTVYHINRAAPLSAALVVAGVVTALLFVAIMITGGLLDIDANMPAALSLVHHITPYLTVLSTIVTLYLLVGHLTRA